MNKSLTAIVLIALISANLAIPHKRSKAAQVDTHGDANAHVEGTHTDMQGHKVDGETHAHVEGTHTDMQGDDQVDGDEAEEVPGGEG